MPYSDSSGIVHPTLTGCGIQRLLDHFNRRDEDLHRTFCEFLEGDDAEKTKVLLNTFYEELFDAATMVLCNYTEVIDGRGKRHDVVDITSLIGSRMSEIYMKYLGKPYESRLARIIKQRQEGG